MTLDQLVRHLVREALDQEVLREYYFNISRHHFGDCVLAGIWCQAGSAAQRLIPLAVRENTSTTAIDRSNEWMFWTVLLLPPHSTDTTTLLNVLSGLADNGIWVAQMKSSAVLQLVAEFLVHTLAQSAIVAERAIDLLAVLPNDVLAVLPRLSEVLTIARQRIAIIDDQIIKDELDICVSDAEKARTSSSSVRQPSTGRLRVDIAEVLSYLPAGEASTLACIGLRRLEAYLIGISRENGIRLVQRVRFKSARDNDGALDDRRVGAGFNAWSKFNEWWISAFSGHDAKLLPASAAVGSFQLDLILESDGKQAEKILSAADQLAEYASGNLVLPEASRWGQLVEVLTEFGLTMSVAHYWGIRESKTIDFDRTSMRTVKRRVSEGPAKRVESLDVPQANVIDKVFEIAEQISHASTIEMDVRDINYYRRAAKILGLIDEKTDTLTAAGRQIIRLNKEDRLKTAVILFETSTVGEAWISFSNGKTLLDIDVGTAESFLVQRSTLTGDTIKRRAKVLRAWHASLSVYHYLNKQPPKTSAI